MKYILIPVLSIVLRLIGSILLLPFYYLFILLQILWKFKKPDLSFKTKKILSNIDDAYYIEAKIQIWKSLFHYIWGIEKYSEYIRIPVWETSSATND